MNIRPVSDLRNKFLDIEKIVLKGEPVILTKNGYGSMVVISMDTYERIGNVEIEKALDVADQQAKITKKRLSHKEVFANIRGHINAK